MFDMEWVSQKILSNLDKKLLFFFLLGWGYSLVIKQLNLGFKNKFGLDIHLYRSFKTFAKLPKEFLWWLVSRRKISTLYKRRKEYKLYSQKGKKACEGFNQRSLFNPLKARFVILLSCEGIYFFIGSPHSLLIHTLLLFKIDKKSNFGFVNINLVVAAVI